MAAAVVVPIAKRTFFLAMPHRGNLRFAFRVSRGGPRSGLAKNSEGGLKAGVLLTGFFARRFRRFNASGNLRMKNFVLLPLLTRTPRLLAYDD
jgi:hypothetical protein